MPANRNNQYVLSLIANVPTVRWHPLPQSMRSRSPAAKNFIAADSALFTSSTNDMKVMLCAIFEIPKGSESISQKCCYEGSFSGTATPTLPARSIR